MNNRFQIIENKTCDFIDTNNMNGCNQYSYGDAIDMLNEAYEKIAELNDRIDELEDDNTRYHLGTGKPEMKNPRYEITGCPTEIKDTSNNHYHWLELDDNVKEVCNILNDYDTKLEYEKRMHQKYKTECLHIHETIQTAYETEKTTMGKSILKQLIDTIK